MVALQTVVFAIAASTAIAENLKMRGTTDIFSRDDATLDEEFADCETAIKAQGKPTVTQPSENVFVVTNYPAVCEEEAKAFKPIGNMTMTVSDDQIIIKNAPIAFITAVED